MLTTIATKLKRRLFFFFFFFCLQSFLLSRAVLLPEHVAGASTHVAVGEDFGPGVENGVERRKELGRVLLEELAGLGLRRSGKACGCTVTPPCAFLFHKKVARVTKPIRARRAANRGG